MVSDGGETESLSLGGLCPQSCILKIFIYVIGSLFSVCAAATVKEVKSDYRIFIDVDSVSALDRLAECECRVGLTQNEINVTYKHVLERDGLVITCIYCHLRACGVGIKPCTEGDAPFAVFDESLGKHTLEFTRDLLAVLAFGSKAPNADMLASLNDHIVREHLRYRKIRRRLCIESLANHYVGNHGCFFLSFGRVFFALGRTFFVLRRAFLVFG